MEVVSCLVPESPLLSWTGGSWEHLGMSRVAPLGPEHVY